MSDGWSCRVVSGTVAQLGETGQQHYVGWLETVMKWGGTVRREDVYTRCLYTMCRGLSAQQHSGVSWCIIF